MDAYDVVIIGAGPAGLSASKTLAKAGKRVLIVDKDPVGGTCLNYGCMPTKFRLKFGSSPESLQRQRKMVEDLNKAIEKSLRKRGIDVLQGKARLKDRTVVEVGGKEVRASSVVLAVGSRPRGLPAVVVDNRRVFFAEQLLWHLPQRKVKRMQIIGAGAIGIEFAFMFRELAEEVLVCDLVEEILPREDKEIAGRLRAMMRRQGIEFQLGAPCKVDGSADLVLIGIGREPNWEGLEETLRGLELARDERGFLAVDESYRSSVEGIYCAGECIGRMFFANTASYEGKVCALSILGRQVGSGYPAIPRCVFSDPPLASVGEQRADLMYGSVNYPHGEMYYLYPVSGKIKIGIDGEERVRFVSMLGPGTPELLPLFTLAVEVGVEFSRLRDMLYVHPTLAEAIGRIRFS